MLLPAKAGRKTAGRFPTVGLMLGATLCMSACAGGQEMIVQRIPEGEPQTAIMGTAIASPLGYYAMIKDGGKYCALKFLEIGHSQAKEPGSEHPRERYALYEWHYQGDGSGDLRGPTSRNGTSKATWKFVPFIGRLSFQTGNVGVACGDIAIAWYGGTSLLFASPREDQTEQETIKRGIEIAPTKWTDLKEVNPFDTRLTWYRYDAKRKSRSVAVRALY